MPVKSNQIVSNSLAEALQDFQRDLAPLLKLGEISEWNGKSLKQREEKIREAALVLGGQCIAILLEKLAAIPEVQSRALTQTQGWWRKKTRKHGSKEQKILTIGNVIVNLKLPYVVERKSRKDYKKKNQRAGILSVFKMVRDGKKSNAISLGNLCREWNNAKFFCHSSVNLKRLGN